MLIKPVSGRGQRFAARWAELVFAYPNLETGRKEYAAFKQNVADHGDPEKVKVAVLTHCVTAETRAAKISEHL